MFNSILTNIKIGLAITLLLLAIVFIAFLKYSQMEHLKQTSHYYESIGHHLHTNRIDKLDAIKYMKTLNFETVDDYRYVLDHAQNKIGGRGIEVLEYDESFYFFLQTPHFRLMMKDLNNYERNYYGHILFAVLFITFIFMYLWMMRALAPLKSLKKEIQKFANGDLNINTKSDKKDEIAQISNEFDSAVGKISLLINSRQLFLRTIMHELKTPIAKGRIVSELIDDEKQKKRIITIFEKLNLLIDDFAKVEQIVSNNYTPNIYKCKVDATLNKAVDMLMLDNKENIKIQKNSNKTIDADMDLLALALKNLIDNALKYSSNKKVYIIINEDKLEFISRGEALKKPLEEYYKPFHNDTKSKNHGMGLGLYIVHSIVKMHGMELAYKYEENQNIFSVVYSK